MIAMITGGSGSGKSAFAEKLAIAQRGNPSIYLATMRNRDDEETRERIKRHRAMRADKGFFTLEQSMDIGSARIPNGASVLIEDLPNLAANELFDGGDIRRIVPAIKQLTEKCSSLIIVTGNVSCDGVEYDETTAAYLDTLSGLEAWIAGCAELVIEVVCGIPIPIKGELPCV